MLGSLVRNSASFFVFSKAIVYQLVCKSESNSSSKFETYFFWPSQRYSDCESKISITIKCLIKSSLLRKQNLIKMPEGVEKFDILDKLLIRLRLPANFLNEVQKQNRNFSLISLSPLDFEWDYKLVITLLLVTNNAIFSLECTRRWMGNVSEQLLT